MKQLEINFSRCLDVDIPKQQDDQEKEVGALEVEEEILKQLIRIKEPEKTPMKPQVRGTGDNNPHW